MKTKSLGLFRMIDTDSSYFDEAEELAKSKAYAFNLQCYLRHLAHRSWDVRTEGYTIRNDNYVDPSRVPGRGYGTPEIKEFWRESGDPDFFPMYTMAWGKAMRRNCGNAQQGGFRSMVNKTLGSSNCGNGTIAHEGLHMMGGISHSGVMRGNDTSKYGDETCLMGGGGRNQAGLNAHKLRALDLEGYRKTLTLTESREVLIAALELPDFALHPDEYTCVILQVPDHDDIYLSIRKTKGTPFPQYPKSEGRLYAHIVYDIWDEDAKQWSTQSARIEKGMMPGKTWILPNVTIRYREYDDETARVFVDFGE